MILPGGNSIWSQTLQTNHSTRRIMDLNIGNILYECEFYHSFASTCTLDLAMASRWSTTSSCLPSILNAPSPPTKPTLSPTHAHFPPALQQHPPNTRFYPAAGSAGSTQTGQTLHSKYLEDLRLSYLQQSVHPHIRSNTHQAYSSSPIHSSIPTTYASLRQPI